MSLEDQIGNLQRERDNLIMQRWMPVRMDPVYRPPIEVYSPSNRYSAYMYDSDLIEAPPLRNTFSMSQPLDLQQSNGPWLSQNNSPTKSRIYTSQMEKALNWDGA